MSIQSQKDHLPSFDTSNKWSEGYICIAGDSILNGIDGSLPSQKRLVKVRQFLGAAITDMYDHLKTILKRNPEFLILHIGTNDTSKYTPNEIVDRGFALRRFVASQNKECKVIISTLAIREDSSKNRNAVQNVNEILNSLIISLVKNVNEYGTSRVAMNYIVALRNCETTLAIRSVILI